MDAVPVAQPFDASLPANKQPSAEERKEMNKKMFQIVIDRLASGVNIAIFPEGTCHSTPAIKDLKLGTARMALEVAADGSRRRIPIVPIGLSYSAVSGSAFRSQAMVNVGPAVDVTDADVALFTSGRAEDAVAAQVAITERLERALRRITVNVPDWTDRLAELATRRGWPPPTYECRQASPRDGDGDGAGEGTGEAGSGGKVDGVDGGSSGSGGDGNVAPFGAVGESARSKSGGGAATDAAGLPRRQWQRVTVSIGGHRFHSPLGRESMTAARRRAAGQPAGPPPDELCRDAARAALMQLSGAAGSSMARASDGEIVAVLQLAVKLYKPHGVQLDMGVLGSLTRNFIAGALSSVGDPVFLDLWARLQKYQRLLDMLGVSDKYVATHAVGSDTVGERLRALRQAARLSLLAKAVTLPLAAVGAVTHAPVAALSVIAGKKLGVTAEGDRSVEATMRIIAGFSGVLAMYPSVAVATSYATGSWLYTGGAVSLLAASGYAAAQAEPHQLLRRLQGQWKLLTQDDNVDRLRAMRAELQSDVRAFADATTPAPELRGWWRDPEAFFAALRDRRAAEEDAAHERHVMVTPAALEQAGLTSVSVRLGDGERSLTGPGPSCADPLPQHPAPPPEALSRTPTAGTDGGGMGAPPPSDARHHRGKLSTKRHPDERAVLTFRQVRGNRKALLWLPGYNDSFFHVHILDRLLGAGFDVFALDLRRCGRARFSAVTGEETTPELLAHDTYDFREYFEEIDATLSFLKSNRPLPAPGQWLQDGGSGVGYDKIVAYGHSTGALVAALYGNDDPAGGGGAWRGAIDGYIFNSPMWDWNLSWYEGMVVKAGASPDYLVRAGGGPSEYSEAMYKRYKFPPQLKSRRELSATSGWCHAVSRVQAMVAEGKITLHQPTLVLTTPVDTTAGRTDELSDMITSDGDGTKGVANDGKARSICSTLLVERSVGSSPTEPSAHDVLAAPSARRVEEALHFVEDWLRAHFPANK